MDLTGKLQIKRGQSVAVVNPPPGLVLPGVVATATAADADAVVVFVTRQEDLDSAEQAVAAARADRLAWISYPKGGRLGTDLNRDRLAAALAAHGVQPVRPGVHRRHLVCAALPPGERVNPATPPAVRASSPARSARQGRESACHTGRVCRSLDRA